jgi:hypothetical protein
MVLPVLSLFNYISCHGHTCINSHLHAIYTKLQNKQILGLDNLTFQCGGLHEEFGHLQIYFVCLESEKIKLKSRMGQACSSCCIHMNLATQFPSLRH